VIDPIRAAAAYDRFVLELGGSHSWLNHHKGDWAQAYSVFSYTAPSGFKVYTTADNSVRFGENQYVYGLGTDIPTNVPHGVLHLGYLFSPRTEVLPSSAFVAGYDLHSGGGWSYTFGFLDRSFSTTSAANYTVGVDKHWGDNRLGYFLVFATEAKANTTVGISQGLQWTKYLPSDTITTTVGAGRGVESTGKNKVGAHDVVAVAVDELHWIDARFALRVAAGYSSISNAYQRYSSIFGLRVRL
jgi:YaiO family outer membrane protein